MNHVRKKVLLLADINSSHTIKWANSLVNANFDVVLFSFGENKEIDFSRKLDKIKYFSLGVPFNIQQRNETSISKVIYFRAFKMVRKIISEFSPHLLHAHYASSYGLLGALSGFQPLIISVWGSDVENFPNQSYFHRQILKFNLRRATKVLATSKYLARETNRYTDKDLIITPFGVDINVFKPLEGKGSFDKNDMVIGTVKSLESVYGISTLISAFSIIRKEYKDIPLTLLIVGRGSEEKKLKELSKKLLNENVVKFVGYIDHELISKYYNMIDIGVFLSNKESFGVAVLEAMACGKPVVVSDVGGLVEIVDEGINGFVVPNNNPVAAANAIKKLIFDKNLRTSMARNGREKVINEYCWDETFKIALKAYNDLI
jgi:L-malate glycosyltransferase